MPRIRVLYDVGVNATCASDIVHKIALFVNKSVDLMAQERESDSARGQEGVRVWGCEGTKV